MRGRPPMDKSEGSTLIISVAIGTSRLPVETHPSPEHVPIRRVYNVARPIETVIVYCPVVRAVAVGHRDTDEQSNIPESRVLPVSAMSMLSFLNLCLSNTLSWLWSPQLYGCSTLEATSKP